MRGMRGRWLLGGQSGGIGTPGTRLRLRFWPANWWRVSSGVLRSGGELSSLSSSVLKYDYDEVDDERELALDLNLDLDRRLASLVPRQRRGRGSGRGRRAHCRTRADPQRASDAASLSSTDCVRQVRAHARRRRCRRWREVHTALALAPPCAHAHPFVLPLSSCVTVETPSLNSRRRRPSTRPRFHSTYALCPRTEHRRYHCASMRRPRSRWQRRDELGRRRLSSGRALPRSVPPALILTAHPLPATECPRPPRPPRPLELTHPPLHATHIRLRVTLPAHAHTPDFSATPPSAAPSSCIIADTVRALNPASSHPYRTHTRTHAHTAPPRAALAAGRRSTPTHRDVCRHAGRQLRRVPHALPHLPRVECRPCLATPRADPRASWSPSQSAQSSARSTCSRPYDSRAAALDVLRDAAGDCRLRELTRIRHIFVPELVLRLHVLLLESHARTLQCVALHFCSPFFSNMANHALPTLTARVQRRRRRYRAGMPGAHGASRALRNSRLSMSTRRARNS